MPYEDRKNLDMKNWIITFTFLALAGLFAGCGSEGTSNVASDADAQALADYEAALAEADAMTEGYEGE